jgi:hypothetical protein
MRCIAYNDPVVWKLPTGRSDVTNDRLVHYGVRSHRPARPQREGFADILIRRVPRNIGSLWPIWYGTRPKMVYPDASRYVLDYITDTSS